MPNLSWPHQSITHCEYTHCYIREENESSRTSCRAPCQIRCSIYRAPMFHFSIVKCLVYSTWDLLRFRFKRRRDAEAFRGRRGTKMSAQERGKGELRTAVKRWRNRWPASGHCSWWLQLRMESYSVELRFHRWWKHLQINIQWPKRLQKFNDIY